MAEIFGSSRSEVYEGADENDLLYASGGSDTLHGGTGIDTAIYDAVAFPEGVAINNTDAPIDDIPAFTAGKRGVGVDVLVSIEAFHGSNSDDVIYPGPFADYVLDRGGDDVVSASQIEGAPGVFFGAGSGDDLFVGSVGPGDTVDYHATFSNDIRGAAIFGAVVDLAAGTARDPWGDSDILVGIENAWGSFRDDLIVGTDGYNLLRGRRGDDVLRGAGGDDVLDGGPGDDTLDGGEGNADVADYRRDPISIFANLAGGTVRDGWGYTDTLIGIEGVRGTEFDDTILGGAGADGLRGGGGDDLLQGGEGDDLLDGGPGSDTLDGGAGSGDRVLFSGARSAVLVDLAAGTALDGEGGIDVLIGIEQVSGTAFDDVLIGAPGAPALLDGAEGADRLVAGDGAGLLNALRGGLGNDTLIGGAGGFNFFEPGPGNDLIVGGAGGYDEIAYDLDDLPEADGRGIRVFFTGPDQGRINDPWKRTDIFSGIEVFRGTEHSDEFRGNAEDQVFRGLAGDDTLDGGGGMDRADYGLETAEAGAVAGIVLDLALGVATDGFGDTDVLSGIEDVIGTGFADRMRGSDGADTLDGAGGDDTLEGGGGDDFLRGGEGIDTAVFAGAPGDYAISFWGDKGIVDVADGRAAGTGYDGLEGIELLRFTGDGGAGAQREIDLRALSGAISLEPAQMMRLVEMYVAYFDRAPDAPGLLYWGTRLAEGMVLAEIAASFFAQEEAAALLPRAEGAGDLVDAAYANLLERGADAAGRAFWVDALESGQASRGDFMMSLISGARGAGGAAEDVAVIEAKAQIGWRYAVDYGLTDPARAAEAMAAYDPSKGATSLEAVEGVMAEFRDAAIAEGSDELVIRIGAFGAEPLGP